MVLKEPMEILIVDDSSTIRLSHSFALLFTRRKVGPDLGLLEKNKDIKLIISDLNMAKNFGSQSLDTQAF